MALRNELDLEWEEKLVKGCGSYIPHTWVGDILNIRKWSTAVLLEATDMGVVANAP